MTFRVILIWWMVSPLPSLRIEPTWGLAASAFWVFPLPFRCPTWRFWLSETWGNSCHFPLGIDVHDWICKCVCESVCASFESHWIGLGVAADGGVVVAVPV